MIVTEYILPGLFAFGANLFVAAIVWGKMTERLENTVERLHAVESALKTDGVGIAELETENQRLSVALWGYDGKNGLRGNLKDLSAKVDNLQGDVGEVRSDIRNIEEKLSQIVKMLENQAE